MAESSRTSEQNLLIQARLDKQAARKQVIGRIVPYFGLVFLFIFFTIVTKGLFISKKNLSNMVEQCFTMCIVATGAAFVYAQGNMDFSIGSACGVAQMCGAILLLHKGWPMPLAMAVTILVPVLTCSLVSTIAVVFRVPVFIGSMCVRSLLAGLLTIGVAKAEIVIPVSNWPIMTNGVFKAAVMLAIIAVGVYLFHFTRVGKWAKAIGGNRNTAKQAGIKIVQQQYLAYILLGICVGIAGVFQMFRNSTVSTAAGTGIEFNIMLAVVLGGFPMSGGDKANLPAAVVGTITATLLTNGLAMWGLEPNLVNGVKGIIFVIMVGLSYDRSAGKLVT